MRYIPNWEQIAEKFCQYWARENHDRPLLLIKAPKKHGTPPPPAHHATLRDRWLDTDYVIACAHHRFESTYYAGEAVANLFPNLGPDLFAALYGIPLVFGETTSWSRHTLNTLDAWADVALDRQGFYYRTILQMTEDIVEDARDRYLVGVTDLHPGLDGLAAMRGPQTLCVDTIESPEWVRTAATALFEGFRTIYGALAEITTKYQRGTINWMEVWHPGRWYVTSCDFCCMISPDMFDTLVLPELHMELDYLDASIFHLDGPGALRHLDRLLAIPGLRGVQWVYGEGQPTAAHWIDVLRRIQNAGKCVHVSATPRDLPVLLENLRPEGMLYQITARDEEEARALVALAQKHTRRVY